MDIERIRATREQLIDAVTLLRANRAVLIPNTVMGIKDSILAISNDVTKKYPYISSRLQALRGELFLSVPPGYSIECTAFGQIVELFDFLIHEAETPEQDIWNSIHPRIVNVSQSLYHDGHYLALWFGFTPFLPKIALDDRIPIVSVFIVPYIWSYAYWAMGPMAVSKCEKEHFADYMAASLISCLAGVLVLAFFPTYMDRVAEGLYEVPVNPTVFDRLRMFWYSLDGSEMAYNLLPSFHCINSTLCYLGVAGRKEIPVWFRAYSLVTTFLIYASTVYVKQHYFLDIITGAALALAVYFVCKKFHWGRMFRPAVRFYAAWKAKKHS